ncbi:unnamed protein product [Paramecium octaurelia]|uniref:Uncharacterized protein n=1 Tax=Paramecium octaurelia TaxID=43137 RepID=A0A8S1XJC6_PAROT|nr:unnamed protein product [Paramecium octaurelia]
MQYQNLTSISICKIYLLSQQSRNLISKIDLNLQIKCKDLDIILIGTVIQIYLFKQVKMIQKQAAHAKMIQNKIINVKQPDTFQLLKRMVCNRSNISKSKIFALIIVYHNNHFPNWTVQQSLFDEKNQQFRITNFTFLIPFYTQPYLFRLSKHRIAKIMISKTNIKLSLQISLLKAKNCCSLIQMTQHYLILQQQIFGTYQMIHFIQICLRYF